MFVDFSSLVPLHWNNPGAFYTNDWAVIKRKDERTGQILRRLTEYGFLSSVASIEYQTCYVTVTRNSEDSLNQIPISYGEK